MELYILLTIVIILLVLVLLLINKNMQLNKLHYELLNKNNENQTNTLSQVNSNINYSLDLFQQRIHALELNNEQKLDAMRITIEKRLSYIQEDNHNQLEKIRITVDEKLDEKMTKSFQLVNERLESVYKGLGEMTSLATGVGDLKKIIANVKTRGILGEVQLGAILEEILAPNQYEKNIATIPNSRNVVEYAIKLPGDNENFIYLPIDAKFPADAYINIQDALESNDKKLIQDATTQYSQRLKQFAKDIKSKYIASPHTTDFAIMFLPFEGMYAQAINLGLIEILQNDYHICIAGPSTMAALLNTIQMGFQTLALQKRSSEVWEILGSVKGEFDKFNDILILTQQRLDQANKELDKLVGVRTRAIQRSLKDVSLIEND